MTALTRFVLRHKALVSLLWVVVAAAESGGPAGQTTVAALERTLVGRAHVIGVGGDGASLIDFDRAVYGDFPLMLAIIGVATFLLLVRAFRSVLLAAKAVVFNLISLAAAYGVLTWVWQDGHGSRALWGIPATGAITMWVPLMVFAFLFGLSMSTGPQTDLKVLATGLGAGILIDAAVVRCLLVPALVALFGRANWWLPAPLARVLRVPAHESVPALADAPGLAARDELLLSGR
jgi:putative drug exporter of the RND superfamily